MEGSSAINSKDQLKEDLKNKKEKQNYDMIFHLNYKIKTKMKYMMKIIR